MNVLKEHDNEFVNDYPEFFMSFSSISSAISSTVPSQEFKGTELSDCIKKLPSDLLFKLLSTDTLADRLRFTFLASKNKSFAVALKERQEKESWKIPYPHEVLRVKQQWRKDQTSRAFHRDQMKINQFVQEYEGGASLAGIDGNAITFAESIENEIVRTGRQQHLPVNQHPFIVQEAIHRGLKRRASMDLPITDSDKKFIERGPAKVVDAPGFFGAINILIFGRSPAPKYVSIKRPRLSVY